MNVDQLDDIPRTEAEVVAVLDKTRAALRPAVAAFTATQYQRVAHDGVQTVALAQELLRQVGLLLFAKDYPDATLSDVAACGAWFEDARNTLADAFEAHLARRRAGAGGGVP